MRVPTLGFTKLHALPALLASFLLAACVGPFARTPAPAPAPAGGGAQAAAAPAPDNTPAEGGGGGGGGGRAGAGGGAGANAAPRAYNRVVTAETQTRDGLFKVHRTGQTLLFEIPRSQLDKDLLVVTEIAETVLGSGYGGQAAGNRVVRFERRDNRVFMRTISFDAQATPGTPEALAVQAANVAPIVAVFNIEAFGADSAAVIDVSRIFTAPPPELGLGTRIPGNIDAARSWIDKAVPFPDNVNVEATLTFARQGNAAPAAPAGGGAAPANNNPSNTVVVHWSFHKLPDAPMQGRICDDRVGFFTETYTDYTDKNNKVSEVCYITRYRLEKRDPNAAVSDPVRPIVYYIDPATPTKWIPYVKQGIEDWQKAFLAAGFSNAIVARDAPADPDWSPEDARYSVVRWLPSTTENASGPNVHDPRSGEILNAHIQFYQNVERLQLSWYFTQAAALDPRARQFPFSDELMGRLLRYVVAHEVGHTIGLQHNMKASSAYPVDSLRSPSFVRTWGHTPSIMDYSRMNYVAQPEDGMPVELLIPDVGVYDNFAIRWGYAPIAGARTPEAERVTLDTWAREQDTKPYLRFSTSGAAGTDPGDLTEAVGDQDAVKATRLGIENIKRIIPYVVPATTANKTESYDDMGNLYGRVISQWRTELNHVVNIVGGTESQERYPSQATQPGQPAVRFRPITRPRQAEAVAFLNEQAFKTQSWLLPNDILRTIEPSGTVQRVVGAQTGILSGLLSNARLIRMSEYAQELGTNGYPITDLMRDLRRGIFSELTTNGDIDVYRRSLQRSYIENLSTKLNPPPPAPAAAGGGGGGGGGGGAAAGLDPKLSDINPAARAELRDLDVEIAAAIPRARGFNRAHLEDLRFRISEALKGKTISGTDDPQGPGN